MKIIEKKAQLSADSFINKIFCCCARIAGWRIKMSKSPLFLLCKALLFGSDDSVLFWSILRAVLCLQDSC